MNDYFCFKGNICGKGSVIQLYEEYEKDFNFHSNLVFEKYNSKTNTCCFHSLYSCWDKYEVPLNQVECIIKDIIPVPNGISEEPSTKVQEKYVEGIVSAWIWYIAIMFFGLLLQGPINIILTWLIASIVFFSWRRKKINGG